MISITYIDKDIKIIASQQRDTLWQDPGTSNAIYFMHEFMQILNIALRNAFNGFLSQINGLRQKDSWCMTQFILI